MQVAHFWRVLPTQFWGASDIDRNYMMAFYLEKAKQRAVEERFQEEELRRRQAAKG